MKTVVREKKITEICSIIHKCTIHGEKNYMNLDFSSPLKDKKNQLNLPLFLLKHDVVFQHMRDIGIYHDLHFMTKVNSY